MKLTFYGHACFEIDTEKEKFLFDPFLTGNEKATITANDVTCDYLLISHAHVDHLGDAIAIAERTKAKVIAIPEIIRSFPSTITNVQPMNLGGTYETPSCRIKMVLAVHSSGIAGGVPAGFIITFTNGQTLYYSGDTALFGDMKLFGELFDIDYALLPIGDNYTMGPSDALQAAKFLKTKTIIPVHYNTWPVIEQDPKQFKKIAEKDGISVKIMNPGDTIVL